MTNIEKVVPDCNHQSLQHFISNSHWDEEGVISEIPRKTSELFWDPVHGSMHFDDSGYLKDGENSVGVKRQYCGRFGKVDNYPGGCVPWICHTQLSNADRQEIIPSYGLGR